MNQSDDPSLFSALTQQPQVAWPTVFLVVGVGHYRFPAPLPTPGARTGPALSEHIESGGYGVALNPGIALSELPPRTPPLSYRSVLSVSESLARKAGIS